MESAGTTILSRDLSRRFQDGEFDAGGCEMLPLQSASSGSSSSLSQTGEKYSSQSSSASVLSKHFEWYHAWEEDVGLASASKLAIARLLRSCPNDRPRQQRARGATTLEQLLQPSAHEEIKGVADRADDEPPSPPQGGNKGLFEDHSRIFAAGGTRIAWVWPTLPSTNSTGSDETQRVLQTSVTASEYRGENGGCSQSEKGPSAEESCLSELMQRNRFCDISSERLVTVSSGSEEGRTDCAEYETPLGELRQAQIDREEWLSEQTNLDLFYARKKKLFDGKQRSMPTERSQSECHSLDSTNSSCEDTNTDQLYEARHPSLAPLIHVFRIESTAYDNGIVSVYDITPGRYRSLHSLLRCKGFLTSTLLPGHYASDDEVSGMCRCDSEKGNIKPRRWTKLKGRGSEERNERTRARRRLGERQENSNRGDCFGKRRMYRAGSGHRSQVVDMRARFIILQLLHAVDFAHSRGLSLGEQLRPDRIFVQDDGWLRIVVPITSQVSRRGHCTKGNNTGKQGFENDEHHAYGTLRKESSNERSHLSVLRVGCAPSGRYESKDHAMFLSNERGVGNNDVPILPYPGYGLPLSTQWQNGAMSNLAYLLHLNAAAGRTTGDPLRPPILPWVTDFTERIADPHVCKPGQGWRDLCKTKFRLHKGDEQLDHTYENTVPPHHIPEGLSDLTYTVYRARCTPMSTLRAIVRDRFVPGHYPDSMLKLYKWTPDEATLEFYDTGVDPCIFKSCHESSGMKDLQVPYWCHGDWIKFVSYHRTLLEGDFVSRWLHVWIDLNFGESLSGERALQEKNVVLHRVSWEGVSSCNDGEGCQGDCDLHQSCFAADCSNIVRSANESVGQAPDTASQRERGQKGLFQGSPSKRTYFVQLFREPHPRRIRGLRGEIGEHITTRADKNPESIADGVCEEGRPERQAVEMKTLRPKNGNPSRPIGEVSNNKYQEELDFDILKRMDLFMVGSIAKELYQAGQVIPPVEVRSAIETMQQGRGEVHQFLSYSRNGEALEQQQLFPYHLEQVYEALAGTQNVGFENEATDCAQSSSLHRLRRTLETWSTTSSIRDNGSGPAFFLLLPVIENVFSSPQAYKEDESLHERDGASRAASKPCRVSRKLCDFVGVVGDCLGSTGASKFVLPRVLALLRAASKARDAYGLRFLRTMLLSRLVPILYSKTTGETFLMQVVPFMNSLLCNHSHTSVSERGAVKKAVGVSFAMLAQDDALGKALCCRYVVPQLVSNLGDLHVHDTTVLWKQMGVHGVLSFSKSPIVQALVGLISFLPEEATGMLICQPILNVFLPSTFDQALVSGSNDEDAFARTDIYLPPYRDHMSSNKSSRLWALGEMIAVLRASIPHLDPASATRHFFHKSALSMKKMLHSAFLLAVSLMDWGGYQHLECSYGNFGVGTRSRSEGSLDFSTQTPLRTTNRGERRTRNPSAVEIGPQVGDVAQLFDLLARSLLSEAESLICSLAQNIPSDQFPSTIYPICEAYFNEVAKTFDPFLQQSAELIGKGSLLCWHAFSEVCSLPGMSVAKTLSSLCGPGATEYCPSMEKLSFWIDNFCSKGEPKSGVVNAADVPGRGVTTRELPREAISLNCSIFDATFDDNLPVEESAAPYKSSHGRTTTNNKRHTLNDFDSNGALSPNDAKLEETGGRSDNTEKELVEFSLINGDDPGGDGHHKPLDARGKGAGFFKYTDKSRNAEATNEAPPRRNQMLSSSQHTVLTDDLASKETLERRRADWAWTMGLRPQWRKPWSRIGSPWQSRMILLSSLVDEKSGGDATKSSKKEKYRVEATVSGVQCLSVNSSESIVASGNSGGEVCLWDLRRHPPEVVARIGGNGRPVVGQMNDFFTELSSDATAASRSALVAPVKQINFLEQGGKALACDGFLHFLDIETGCVVNSTGSSFLYPGETSAVNYPESWVPAGRGVTENPFLAFASVDCGATEGFGSLECCHMGEIMAITSSRLFRIDMRSRGGTSNHSIFSLPTSGARIGNRQYSADVCGTSQSSIYRHRTWVMDPSKARFASQKNDVRADSRREMTDSRLVMTSPTPELPPTTGGTSFGFTCVTTGCGDGDWVCIGSHSGHIHCFERRTGRLLHCWKGHSKAVVSVHGIARNKVLTVSRDRTSVVWDLNSFPQPEKLSCIRDLPDDGRGLGMQTTALHQFRRGAKTSPRDSHLSTLYAACGNKAVFAGISETRSQDVKASPDTFRDVSGKVLSSRKLSIQSIALLPLRQLILLGCADGKIHVCV